MRHQASRKFNQHAHRDEQLLDARVACQPGAGGALEWLERLSVMTRSRLGRPRPSDS